MNCMTAKNQLRQELLEKFSNNSNAAVAASSQVICQKLISEFALHTWSSICCYRPILSLGEIDPSAYLSHLENSDSHPVVTLLGSSKTEELPKEKFDLIILPVLGFTAANYRLGRGGGWYDRFLAEQPQATTVGLAYSWSQVDFTPEAHDVALDYIITD